MVLAAFVFACLVFSFQEVRGQTFCSNGIIPCVTNAFCNASSDQCACNSATPSGNGRVFCAGNRCTCLTLADPHWIIFDSPPSQAMFTANLPCSVDLVRPSGSLIVFGFCVLNYITAHPEVRSGSDPSTAFRTFVNSLEVSLLVSGSPIVFTVSDSSVNVTTSTGGTPTTSTSDGFQRAIVNGCSDLEVGVNGTYGGSYVALPMNQNSGSLGGICGNCNGNSSDESVGTNNITQLDYLLQHIAPPSRQSGPFAEICSNISTSLGNCDAAERGLVAAICGRYLSFFGFCVGNDAANTNITSDSTLLAFFHNCVDSACNGGSPSTLCGLLNDQQIASCRVGSCP